MNTENTLGGAVRHITKVLMSCQTIDQLESTYNWGTIVIANRAKIVHRVDRSKLCQINDLIYELYIKLKEVL